MRAYSIREMFICPTLEEFHGILMSTMPEVLALESIYEVEPIEDYLHDYFTLNRYVSRSLVSDQEIDIHR